MEDIELTILNEEFREIAAKWDDPHHYSPAPRHRRRLILSMIKKLHFNECLDAGCAQPYLLEAVLNQFQVKGYGCDMSTQVIDDNKKRMPHCEFTVLNLEKEKWLDEKQFDLVISSEVIEHIVDWKSALKNLSDMTKKYLLITVPSGKIRPIDKKVGHYQHFAGEELVKEIEKHGLSCRRIVRHGFPIHSLYKRLINNIAPDKIYNSFHNGEKYSFSQKIISQIIYKLFFLNYLFFSGSQLFILAERTGEP